MTDFARIVTRFHSEDLLILTDFLEDVLETLGDDVTEEEKRVVADFIEAVEDSDSIEIVDDEEFLSLAD